MSKAVNYYLAAGATGGVAALGVGITITGGLAARHFLQRARQEADTELDGAHLRNETELAAARMRAREAGVAPELVDQSYRDKHLTFDQAIARIQTLSAKLPGPRDRGDA